MTPGRRGLVAALFLAAAASACAAPRGEPIPTCAPGAIDELTPVAARPAPGSELTLRIDCWLLGEDLAGERIVLRFTPPGCEDLSRVTLHESADAVVVGLHAVEPASGPSCEGPESLSTAVELQAPLGTREVLEAAD